MATLRNGFGLLAVTAATIFLTAFATLSNADGPGSNQIVDAVAVDNAEAPARVSHSAASDLPGESPLESPLPPQIPNVVDPDFAANAASLPPMELLRVTLYLDYLPHDAVSLEVNARYQDQLDAVRSGIREIHQRGNAQRRAQTSVDADNYRAGDWQLSDADRRALKALHEENERIGYAVMRDTGAALRAQIQASQAPLNARIEQLGGKVEFTTIAGNTIVAQVPAGSVQALAVTPGVLRIVAPQREESHLNISDATTLVDPADTALTGLWDAGRDGGAYDPAIVDSGTDLGHPGMRDATARDNFYSWYLVTGAADPDYGDFSTEDDLQGHGSHVAGIVGSYGTSIYPEHLGMSFGVDKLVTLKAGWLNSATGRASMYPDDRHHLIDRALYHNELLQPNSTFNDDLEGINVSYGGETSDDDTDSSRFIDSIVSSYADLVVTLSAGNSGPANTVFNSPATSYNAITVANADDHGTVDRVDDTINPGSTRGPTANGRRKPDLAAPGTAISSVNTFWESELDYVPKSGTSMSAPMVLGVAMDLMDAGVLDEKAVKALLINTAQKNEPGIAIENDADGWDPAAGWGLMNAFAAYYHRGDVFTGTVTPRDVAGDYRMYYGTMRDEGAAGEGRDRATMVWNRHATYNPSAPPATYYQNANLNMRLYGESNGTLIDFDTDVDDNVHQVRVGSGAPSTPVIVKVYAWDLSFAHGGATESYALALEEDFVEVELPSDFQGIASLPLSVEPNEVFDYTFRIRNDSAIASHSNQFELVLPAGWTLVSGSTVTNVGSIAGNGGLSAPVTYTLRAQAVPAAAVNIDVRHSHSSYAEAYTGLTWRITRPVEYDTVAPTPNPMFFSTLPDDTSISDIAMIATPASDLHGPVEYYFDFTSSPTGGGGASDSGYTLSRSYTDALLSLNHQFCYRVRTRDTAVVRNYSSYSAVDCAFTAINPATAVQFGTITTSSIDARSANTPAGLTRGDSGLFVFNFTHGTSSGWRQNNNFWISGGLSPNTSYGFAVRARNGDADLTPYSPTASAVTLANPPAAAGFSDITQTSVRALINANGNPPGTAYNVENVTAGTQSGWVSSTSWVSTGLTCNTAYTFQVTARNSVGVETITVPLGVVTTSPCTADSDGDGVIDTLDNCTLVANADQRDSNGDGFGNICDADLNNDCTVNVADLGLLRSVFFTGDADADFNGDGTVNISDLGILRLRFFAAPGPSGLPNACDP